ncbi:MAG: sigma-70 family RNA polymerase sigma factor [Ardenticatenaceae bacterium]|nr:sigma-70 family RNA polymerase sigma factor [Ardenticatenaceae bacterium]HBY96716.1 RNA polymerase subunit sigma-24 [Chloroflexota bacterium]
MTVNEQQERAWVEAALRGNTDAFAQLVAAYADPVYNLCYRMLGDPAEAEDAAQETFIRVYSRLDTYDSSRKLVSWVLSIASHHCIDRIRRRRLQTVSVDDLPPWEPLVGDQPGPERRYLDREREARVQALLHFLPPHYRLPVVLHYWHDLSYQEIAETMDTTVSAVKSRLHRARLMLVEAMNQQAPDLVPRNHAVSQSTRGEHVGVS